MRAFNLAMALIVSSSFVFLGCGKSDDEIDDPDMISKTQLLASGEWKQTSFTIEGQSYDTLFYQIYGHGNIYSDYCGESVSEEKVHKCFMKSTYRFYDNGMGEGTEWYPVYIWSDCHPEWDLLYESRENINEFEFNWSYQPISESDDNTGYLTIENWVGLIEFKSNTEFEIIEFNSQKWLVSYMYNSDPDPNTGLDKIITESYNNVPPPEDYSANRMLEVTTTFKLIHDN